MDRHNMKNVQLHYIQLTTILNNETVLIRKKGNNFSVKIQIYRGYKEEGRQIYTT